MMCPVTPVASLPPSPGPKGYILGTHLYHVKISHKLHNIIYKTLYQDHIYNIIYKTLYQE